VVQFDVEPGAAEIVFGDGAQHGGLVRAADENLAKEIVRGYCFARGEAMVARHRGDERLPVDHVVLEVVARLRAQEGQVELAADERFGEIRGIVAGDG
jgi:hypothetical protein